MKMQVLALLVSILGAKPAFAVDPDFPCSHKHPTECGADNLRNAGGSFIASGDSCFAYQELSDALEQAQTFADAHAARVCGNRKAWRVSEHRRISHGRWCLKLEADYTCGK